MLCEIIYDPNSWDRCFRRNIFHLLFPELIYTKSIFWTQQCNKWDIRYLVVLFSKNITSKDIFTMAIICCSWKLGSESESCKLKNYVFILWCWAVYLKPLSPTYRIWILEISIIIKLLWELNNGYQQHIKYPGTMVRQISRVVQHLGLGVGQEAWISALPFKSMKYDKL